MVIKVKETDQTVISASHAYQLLKEFFMKQDKIDRDKEHFFVIHLNSRNKVKFIELVSIGIVSCALIHPREVFTRVISNRASGILIAHNHPSGEMDPSEDDISVTRRLKECAGILGISFLDHLIVTEDSYYSFKEHELVF